MDENKNAKIYILDDDKNTRRSLQVALENEGYAVTTGFDPMRSFDEILGADFDLLVLDIRLGEITGVELYQRLKREGLEVPTIFMSGHASLSEAVAAVNLGAYDFLEKPFVPEKLLISIARCLELRVLREKVVQYEKQIGTPDFIGKSPAFERVKRSIRKVASTNSPVLIVGESGTGKELIAREIHQRSRVSQGPFVKVNCSAVPENLFESEFFGYEKGAFTGAQGTKKGYFEAANGGTLLLDEIGEMPVNCQAKILRALQNAEIQKLGSEKVTPIRVRVIASTNRDLSQDVRAGKFREDLFYRLNVFPVESPSLRERREDIPLLARYFLDAYCVANGFAQKLLRDKALALLMNYSWPGNIRELKNVIERMAILSGQSIDEGDVPSFLVENKNSRPMSSTSLKQFRRASEREFIVRTLIDVGGNISEAALKLDIERTHLHKKIQEYGILKKEFFV